MLLHTHIYLFRQAKLNNCILS